MRDDYQNDINDNFGINNAQGVEINAEEEKRLDCNYTCKDKNWHTDKFREDVYISVPSQTHDLIVAHHNDPENKEYFLPEEGFPGSSGYFTDEKTASGHFTGDGTFDSIGLGHTLQQSPHYNENAALKAQADDKQYYPEYNGHLDCFCVNEEKMYAGFGTTDLYAAMSQCKENTAWGEGGGYQGYNSYINEMINKGALEYVPERSRTCEDNKCIDYAERKNQASEEAKIVNEHIESHNIQGKQDERLGYNELPRNVNKTENDSFDKVFSEHSNVDKISAGGGNHAPPSHSNNSDYFCPKTEDLAKFPTSSARSKFEVPEKDLASKEELVEGSKNALQAANEAGTSFNLSNKNGLNT